MLGRRAIESEEIAQACGGADTDAACTALRAVLAKVDDCFARVRVEAYDSRALLAVTGKSASEIMGYPDDMKLRSSMMLFSLATTTQPEFNAVLKKFFTGEPDALTFELLGGRR